MAHYGVPVKPSGVVPVPAATLVLLRDRAAGGFDILLMRRHAKSKFAAGDYVFPGGKLTADDNPPDAIRWCTGLDPAAAAKALALEDPALAVAHWIGVIRETFEEVGVLLATGADGGPARVAPAALAECRRACQADNRAFWELVKGADLRLATDRLVYFAHWITPDAQPLRFDTRFFAAPMPSDQTPTGDDKEVTDLRWLAPAEALEAQRRGEISLRNPTIKNLMLFTDAASAQDALDRLRGRAVTTIRPRVIFLPDGTRQVLNPGDPGYEP
ncbi:MAG TPA: NUDIX hydrolase [Methylomirabilota bacterium]|nr:NUDIX hydrolase [Methylomirabilota bacterium]